MFPTQTNTIKAHCGILKPKVHAARRKKKKKQYNRNRQHQISLWHFVKRLCISIAKYIPKKRKEQKIKIQQQMKKNEKKFGKERKGCITCTLRVVDRVDASDMPVNGAVSQ